MKNTKQESIGNPMELRDKSYYEAIVKKFQPQMPMLFKSCTDHLLELIGFTGKQISDEMDKFIYDQLNSVGIEASLEEVDFLASYISFTLVITKMAQG